MKKEFRYPSRDGVTEIHAIEWAPETEVRAVLQISHGMAEYIGRYEEFALYLNERGICVVGNDHLGHGSSVQSKEYYGYFHEENGNACVIADIHRLRERTQEKYPEAPYFMLGHSMGSFLLRQYLTMYSKGLAGAVVMGTGHYGRALLGLGQALCKWIAAFRGWNYRSKLVNNICFGSYNRRFEPGETGREWLSTNEENCRAHCSDPMCNFIFTVNAWYHMFEGMKVLAVRENTGKIRKDLPVFFMAGANDPVGDFGKAVRKVYEEYREVGVRDVRLKLYKGDRHEILNELDRQQVYEDLYGWMTERI